MFSKVLFFTSDVGRSRGTVVAPEEEEDRQGSTILPQTQVPQEISVEDKLDEVRNVVENIGPTSEDTTEHVVPELIGIHGGTFAFLLSFWGHGDHIIAEVKH